MGSTNHWSKTYVYYMQVFHDLGLFSSPVATLKKCIGWLKPKSTNTLKPFSVFDICGKSRVYWAILLPITDDWGAPLFDLALHLAWPMKARLYHRLCKHPGLAFLNRNQKCMDYQWICLTFHDSSPNHPSGVGFFLMGIPHWYHPCDTAPHHGEIYPPRPPERNCTPNSKEFHV